MAYVRQENKKAIAEKLKVALKGTGLKYSLGVRHHSTLVMRIAGGPVDFIGNYNSTGLTRYAHRADGTFQPAYGYLDLNPYYYQEAMTGRALELMRSIMTILNEGNHDRSDLHTDYFDVGWYVAVKIGEFGKPYQLTA